MQHLTAQLADVALLPADLNSRGAGGRYLCKYASIRRPISAVVATSELIKMVQQKQMSTQQNSKNIPNMTQQSKYSGGGLNSRIASGGILYSEVNMVCGVRYVFIGCYKNNCLHNNTQRISPK